MKKLTVTQCALIAEILYQAVWVVQSRGTDISTEDGTFATTSVDQIIELEFAIAAAFSDSDGVEKPEEIIQQIREML